MNNPLKYIDPTGHYAGPAIHDSYGDSPLKPYGMTSSWKLLPDKYTFSGYVTADERDFATREAFLRSYSGVAVQGKGKNLDGTYADYQSGGHWFLPVADGNRREVVVTNGWFYKDTGEAVPKEYIDQIWLEGGVFKENSSPPSSVPFYNVASPSYSDFPKGTIVYAPDLGLILEVNDPCPACTGNERFDLYTGTGFGEYNQFMNRKDRQIIDVFILAPEVEMTYGNQL